MPAAAVIPAPVAYIKVVAVKKLVVEILDNGRNSLDCRLESILTKKLLPINLGGSGDVSFTVNKLGCLKQTSVCIH